MYTYGSVAVVVKELPIFGVETEESLKGQKGAILRPTKLPQRARAALGLDRELMGLDPQRCPRT